jgi:O-methyltransferase
MKQLVSRVIQSLGYTIVRKGKIKPLPPDFEPLHQEVWQDVKNNTMTGPERIYSLIEAVKYIEKNSIPGAIVECGVWKGGSMMAVAKTLQHLGNTSRDLFLYDTFEGMSEPDERDKTYNGTPAEELLSSDTDKTKNLTWAFSTLESVQEAMVSTRYPETRVKYIRGKVEDTIPGVLPSEIALLRLDTDWYESTRHELLHLYPLLKKGGILILDDYGHWAGAKKAVDEYFLQQPQPILLNRIDETGRIAVKQI